MTTIRSEWRRYRRTLGGPRLVVAALFSTQRLERLLQRRWMEDQARRTGDR